MKKGFTLIEMLIVVAIVAILAAILYPVLAQAKGIAHKASAVQSQKQIALGFLMYAGDSDDAWARQDDCQPGSSLNPKHRDRRVYQDGCLSAPLYNRTGFNAWQRWVAPYVKESAVFRMKDREVSDRPTPSCPEGQWSSCGRIVGHFALNLAVTGSLKTFRREGLSNGIRDSFLGPVTTSVPHPSETMLIMEMPNPELGYLPTAIDAAREEDVRVTHFPPAYREIWAHELLAEKNGCKGLHEPMTKIDHERVQLGGLVVGYVDGHAGFVSARELLARTPSAHEYGVPDAQHCGFENMYLRHRGAPNTRIRYPFWGLGE